MLSDSFVTGREGTEWKSNLVLLLFTAVLIIPLTYYLADSGTKFTTRIGLVAFPLLLIGLLNFRIALSIFLVTLFLEINPFFYYSLSAFMVFYLLLSFAVTNKGFTLKDMKTPFTGVMIFFLLTLLPSLVNSKAPVIGILNFLQWGIVLTLIFILSNTLTTVKKINYLVLFYLVMISINAFYSIYQGLTIGRRAFGFAGIMYVDLLGIAIVVVFILMLAAKGKIKWLFGSMFTIMVLSLIFTKTRNVWLNVGMVLLMSFIHLIIKSGYLKIRRQKLIRYGVMAMVIVLVGGGGLISYFGTSFFRLSEKSKLTTESLETGDVSNSLVTRYFIWSTGLNGFLQHPVLGIGIYTFPYTSKFYNQLPEVLFKKFVEMYSMHHGYFAILVEAGILGFIGLIFFLSYLVRKTRKIFREAEDTPFDVHAFISIWVITYILISLFFSDAWFWGRGIIIWSVVLGVISSLDRLVKAFNSGSKN